MSSLYPKPPSLQCWTGLLAGHTPSLCSKRVHPRTSIQSPYSQRFERPTPRRNQCANEIPVPASTLEHYSIKRTRRYDAHHLANRNLVAWGYHQRRSSTRRCEDPAVSAISRTCAEELTGVIEGLVSRLESLDLDDHIDWEAVIPCDMVQCGDSACPRIPYPWPSTSVDIDVPDSSSCSTYPFCAFERTSTFSRSVSTASTDTSLPPLTPQSTIATLEQATVYLPNTESGYGEGSYSGEHEVTVADPDATADAALEAELSALLNEVPTTPKKKAAGSRRLAVSSPRSCNAPRKPRSVSASAVFSALACADSELLSVLGYDVTPSRPAVSYCRTATTASERTCHEPGLTTPVDRRRRKQTVEEASGHSVGTDANHCAEKNRRRRHSDRPYSKDQRTHRPKYGEDRSTDIPISLRIPPQTNNSSPLADKKRTHRTRRPRASGSAVIEPFTSSLSDDRALSTRSSAYSRKSRASAPTKLRALDQQSFGL